MPYKLRWESTSLICCDFFGKVDFSDLNRASEEFFNDFRSDFVRCALWNFSEMSSFDVADSEALEIAATDFAASRYMKPLRAAFVTQNTEFRGLARLYIEKMEQFGSHWSNGLFETVGDARSWLAVE